jgi:hypothetical protein
LADLRLATEHSCRTGLKLDRTTTVLIGALSFAACHAAIPRTSTRPADGGLRATEGGSAEGPLRLVARRVALPASVARQSCSLNGYPRFPSFVVLSEARALFARRGLFAVDLNSGAVFESDTSHVPCQISADGNTVAVSQVDGAGELGLSLDAGKSFLWKPLGPLVRCQESRIVASGMAMLVSCLNGVERWTGGSDTLPSISGLGPKLVGNGPRVVIGSQDAIKLSDDSGAHFSDRGLSGIASGGTVVAVAGDSIIATGRSDDSRVRLYEAHWDAPFHVLPDDLPVSYFDSSGEVLTGYSNERIFVRRDSGGRFREVELVSSRDSGAVLPIDELHYAFGNLYVLSEASLGPDGQSEIAMYVATLP